MSTTSIRSLSQVLPVVGTENDSNETNNKSSPDMKRIKSKRIPMTEGNGFMEDQYIPKSPEKSKRPTPGKIRYDSFGTRIERRKKKHRVCFSQCVENINFVESFKKYNKPNLFGDDDDDDNPRGPCKCQIY